MAYGYNTLNCDPLNHEITIRRLSFGTLLEHLRWISDAFDVFWEICSELILVLMKKLSMADIGVDEVVTYC